MKLARALKEKNRLIGEINRCKGIIARENSRKLTSTSTTNRDVLWKEIDELTEKLIDVKARIFKANTEIYEKIARISELKTRVTWLATISTLDGPQEVPSFRGDSRTENWAAHLKQQDIDQMVAKLQEQIATLQDELDAHNATKEI